MQEGIHTLRLGLDPYSGGFSQPPLLLLLFTALSKLPWLESALFIAADYLIANCLQALGDWKVLDQKDEIWPEATVIKRVDSEIESDGEAEKDNTLIGEVDLEQEEASIPKRAEQAWKDPLADDSLVPNDPSKPIDIPFTHFDIGSMYLLNPLSIIACVAQSNQIFSNLSMALGLYFAMDGKRRASMLSISIGTYLSIYPCLIIGPCVLFLMSFNEKFGNRESVRAFVNF